MRSFLRGFLIFILFIAGVVGVITVDVRSGHMAGYSPAIDMTLTPVDVDAPSDSFALGYEFTFRINNDRILEVINN